MVLEALFKIPCSKFEIQGSEHFSLISRPFHFDLFIRALSGQILAGYAKVSFRIRQESHHPFPHFWSRNTPLHWPNPGQLLKEYGIWSS